MSSPKVSDESGISMHLPERVLRLVVVSMVLVLNVVPLCTIAGNTLPVQIADQLPPVMLWITQKWGQ